MNSTVLIVEDEDNARAFLGSHLTKLGYEVNEANTLAIARKQIESGKADIILLDVQLPDGNGLDLLDELSALNIRPPAIVMTAYGDIDIAVDAMKNGAMDFLTKPIDFDQLESCIQKASEIVAMRQELAHFRRTQLQFDHIIGNTPKMKQIYEHAQKAAIASVVILITGETGTGKDVLAKAIHQMGPRKDKPFIPVDCGAIQNTMLESELFGHEKGAFTSADSRKHGLMELADGGILFLDEISSMPLDTQAKLLRALNDKTFRRVGGTHTLEVDVQIIAASNRDLKAMIEAGEFRDDLYYRIKVVNLHLPPLRERKEDIPDLVGHFIRKKNPRLGKNIQDVTPRALEALIAFDWPGNIRELDNDIENTMVFCDEATIDLHHLPMDLIENYHSKTNTDLEN